MSFIKILNLVFYILTFFVITLIHAHGGVDDEHEDAGPPAKAPSVFANEKQSTLAEGNVGLAFGLTAMAAIASATKTQVLLLKPHPFLQMKNKVLWPKEM
ncbi:hypothetical protein RirG_002060 [Rhizophagus irregularis DAOM 197198w]|uniref:Transmembrane protein n=1 Tax=Rhizophagus irregularis (strain DAOM 197198w) TaxID=1432141 RepID=A0A015M497_RHIIW|nr:hypothetical protein RirG_002060 [Rhizophagus irregularis DAOM 197198w]